MSTWNAIYVSSRQEKKIHAKLVEKGIEAYVPLKKTLSQWSDRKKWVLSPLITGYVFVQSTEQKKDAILQTQGVVSFVRYNGKEAIIRESEINILKSIEEHGYEINLISDTFKSGDTLHVFQGPLKGLVVQVLEINNDDTVCAFVIESIVQNFKVTLPKVVLRKESKVC